MEGVRYRPEGKERELDIGIGLNVWEEMSRDWGRCIVSIDLRRTSGRGKKGKEGKGAERTEGRKVELTPMCLTRAALALSLSSSEGNLGGRILS